MVIPMVNSPSNCLAAVKALNTLGVDADKVGAYNGADQLGRNVWKVQGDLDLRNKNAKFGYR
jgi:hypothetical protein